MKRSATLFGETHELVGVTVQPDAGPAPGLPAVIIFNAGIVHRAGPSRAFVKLERAFVEQGHLVTRFDHSGVGDSDLRRDNLVFEHSSLLETREVMDQLQREHNVSTFILVGLCSGAVTAFRAAAEDPRIVGAVMINAQGYDRSEEFAHYVVNQGWARRYFRISIFRPSAWWRALTGRIEYGRLFRVLWRHIRDRFRRADEVDEVAERIAGQIRRIIAREAKLLLIYASQDEGLDYLRTILRPDELAGFERLGSVQCEVIEGSDHTFTLTPNHEQLIRTITNWVSQHHTSENPREALALT